uniref:E3 ubiquitin-protein ligase SHPRH n=1 Tax=Lygus hesperus TaxID=30085 RepID=A0A0K8SKL6_LYGHE
MSGNSRLDDLYNYVKKIHEARKTSDESHKDEEKLDSMLERLDTSLLVKLRAYQKDAVKWMLRRELATPARQSEFESFVFEGFNVIYPKGGILADEMGLGKTIEVLACILSHPYSDDTEAAPVEDASQLIETSDNVELQRKTDTLAKRMAEKMKGRSKKRKSSEIEEESKEQDATKKRKTKPCGINSEKYASLRALYEQHTSSITSVINTGCDNSSLRCFCDRNPDIDDVITCETCYSTQHVICVGSPSKEEEYMCPWCWTKKTPVRSGCTLIVSPNTISSQWIDEINRHVKSSSLRVLFYEGVKGRKYIQPKDLAEYDIVITTFQVLSVELSYVSVEEESTRKLRHAKKYHTPVSPLTCVEWWRLCLDEAQMVEGSTSKTASMACELRSVHKWAVTGTPIQKTISDLYGLIKFLGIEPFTNQAQWFRLLDDEEECYRFLAPILWRSIKTTYSIKSEYLLRLY